MMFTSPGHADCCDEFLEVHISISVRIVRPEHKLRKLRRISLRTQTFVDLLQTLDIHLTWFVRNWLYSLMLLIWIRIYIPVSMMKYCYLLVSFCNLWGDNWIILNTVSCTFSEFSTLSSEYQKSFLFGRLIDTQYATVPFPWYSFNLFLIHCI